MTRDLDFTGERFVPGVPGEIAYEHWHRYVFARRFVDGKRVLDAACGEGYGTALLGATAASVIGVDIDPSAIAHAQDRYGSRPGLRFEIGSVTSLPLTDRSIDVIVSFETIEHLPAEEQPRMLAEFARVLTDDGLLVLSSPNKRRYSDERNFRNPFHLHELYRAGLEQMLDATFPARRWFHQSPLVASALWGESPATEVDAWRGEGDEVSAITAPDGMYYIVVAAKRAVALPAASTRLSLFVDRNDTELKKAEANAAEVLRLDALLGERDMALERATAHVAHLDELVAYRDRIVVERDRQLVEVNAAREAHHHAWQEALASLEQARNQRKEDQRALEVLRQESQRLEAALAAQERIIAYRQSARWWIRLPWLRVKLLWQRMTGR
jgi:SAM-dependent methyltransferase